MSVSSAQFLSWGLIPKVNQNAKFVNWLSEPLALDRNHTYLPYGLGRSYGDVCLNDQGTILVTSNLNRLISFNSDTGELTCEAGVSLDQILKFCVPKGWFLPVTPGTRFVTVGGAIANDVHGKNHHRAGTFGCHVSQIRLRRSDGSETVCSSENNPGLFKATIGGLGLTGLISSATFKLKPIKNAFIQTESVKFKSLDHYFNLSIESDLNFEYTVAWLDCLSSGLNFGRGIYMRGNSSVDVSDSRRKIPKSIPLPIPFYFPSFVLNQLSIKAFNFAYYNRQLSEIVRASTYYEPFFYPLDGVLGWNKIYGKNGFYQFQCVVPLESDRTDNKVIKEILRTIVRSKQASFLAVLKDFGTISSPGLLSFPRPGVTLALDFANRGNSTRALLLELDKIVSQSGGAIYPAKDGCMPPESFKSYFPRWHEFSNFIDPLYSSSFWRRVQGD